MPAASRLGDKAQVSSDAHGCPACPHPGTGPVIVGSSDVTINGLPAARKDDLGMHAACCGPNIFKIKEGSSTVYVNGKPLARLTDATTHCGGDGSIIDGSSDVFADDGGGAAGGLGALASRALAIALQAAAAIAAGTAQRHSDSHDGGEGGGGGAGGGGGSDLARDGTPAGGSGGPGASGAGAGAGTGAGTGAGAGTGSGAAPAAAVQADQVEVQLVNVKGDPQKKVEVELTLPGGDKRAGHTDDQGKFKGEGITATGNAHLDVPDVQVAPAGPASDPSRTRFVQGGVDVPIGKSTVVELPSRVRRCRMRGMHFETAKTFLLPTAMIGIKQLVKLYKSFEGIVALITGHTDIHGPVDYNRGLSQERADSIKAFLLDDAAGWMKWYAGMPSSDRWGLREDQHMLSAVDADQGTHRKFLEPPFTLGAKDANTTKAIKEFQSTRLEAPTGTLSRAQEQSLVEAYMQIEGTSLLPGSPVETHGCGLRHLIAEPSTPDNDAQNRRVEVFLFEGQIDPKPQKRCPFAGCAEYQKWVDQRILDVDLDAPPGSLRVKVLDDTGKGLQGAEVHASGPLVLDASSDAAGDAAFDELVPGDYKVIADAKDFDAADAGVTVPPGGQGSATLTLKPLAGDLDVTVTDQDGAAAGAVTLRLDPGAIPGSTKPDGTFTFPKQKPGAFTLALAKAGFVAQSVPVTIHPGNNPLAVKLQLDAGDLTVLVQDAKDGSALPADSVTANTTAGQDQGGGKFTFTKLPSGSFTITAKAKGFADGTAAQAIKAGDKITLPLKLTALPAKLDVAVTSPEGKVSGAKVHLAPKGKTAAPADQDTQAPGGVAAFASIEAGDYTVQVSKDGLQPGQQDVTLARGSKQSITIALAFQVGAATVHVQDENGAALEGAQVTLKNAVRTRGGPTGAPGDVSITNVPVDDYDLSAALDDYTAPAPAKQRIDTGVTATPKVVLTASAAAPQIVTGTLLGVKKRGADPGRLPATLRATAPFKGTGTLTISGPNVQAFAAATGSAKATLDKIPGAKLSSKDGFRIFLEASAKSGSEGDVELSLQLFAGANKFKPPAVQKLTAIELQLDVFGGGAAAKLTDAEKIDAGRFLQVVAKFNPAGRAKVLVHAPVPAIADAEQILFERANDRLTIFDAQTGGTEQPSFLHLTAGDLKGGPKEFWLEGRFASGQLRDTDVSVRVLGMPGPSDLVNATCVVLNPRFLQPKPRCGDDVGLFCGINLAQGTPGFVALDLPATLELQHLVPLQPAKVLFTHAQNFVKGKFEESWRSQAQGPDWRKESFAFRVTVPAIDAVSNSENELQLLPESPAGPDRIERDHLVRRDRWYFEFPIFLLTFDLPRELSPVIERHDIERTDGLLKVALRLKLEGKNIDSELPAIKQGIETAWNNGFKNSFLHRLDCKRGRACTDDPDWGCCKLRFKLQVDFNLADPHATVTVKEQTPLGATPNASGMGLLSSTWYHPASTFRRTALPPTAPVQHPPELRYSEYAHECGHLFGNYDEYDNGMHDPNDPPVGQPQNAPGIGDPNIMSADNSDMLKNLVFHARHYRWFVEWLNQHVEKYDLIDF